MKIPIKSVSTPIEQAEHIKKTLPPIGAKNCAFISFSCKTMIFRAWTEAQTAAFKTLKSPSKSIPGNVEPKQIDLLIKVFFISQTLICD